MFVFAKILPLHCDIQTFVEYAVAPYVGAWIETWAEKAYRRILWVAPYVGAWIETLNTIAQSSRQRESHPTWVRGLKPSHRLHYPHSLCRTLRGCVDWNWKLHTKAKIILVAPYVGARIETRKLACGKTLAVSHPMWMRGLNLKIKELKRLVSLHHQGSYA